MITLRKASDRGHADHGWLKANHSFSFANYYDPKHMGFSVLRVINEDYVAGGGGFNTHGHRDMEIITYMIEGALEHKDSMGNTSVIKPGEVQRMSAGTGVRHSEFNHHKDQTAHLLQIWIMPDREGHTPSYEQKSFSKELAGSEMVLVAAPDGRQGAVSLHQDIELYATKAERSGETSLAQVKGRRGWVQVVQGEVLVNGEKLSAGDGASIEDEATLNLKWSANSEFLTFVLP